jgi:hypothetical protein
MISALGDDDSTQSYLQLMFVKYHRGACLRREQMELSGTERSEESETE